MEKINATKKEKAKKLLKEYLSIPITFTFIVLIFNFVLQWGIIPTCSMEPTIQPGSVFLSLRMVDKQGLERGSIVSFQHSNGQHYMKRIIGLPGETLHIKNRAVYIDGVELDETEYLPSGVVTTVRNGAPQTFEIPNGCYFLMGDNRQNSEDSRMWPNPYVSYDSISSVVLFHFKLWYCQQLGC